MFREKEREEKGEKEKLFIEDIYVYLTRKILRFSHREGVEISGSQSFEENSNHTNETPFFFVAFSDPETGKPQQLTSLGFVKKNEKRQIAAVKSR